MKTYLIVACVAVISIVTVVTVVVVQNNAAYHQELERIRVELELARLHAERLEAERLEAERLDQESIRATQEMLEQMWTPRPRETRRVLRIGE